MTASVAASVVALCGGVGGAKLALGLSQRLPPGELAVIVNTGDDFDHLGLRICPDLDTVVYTLGGVADQERGWGRAGETWRFMAATREFGGPVWFQLGDQDLAMHVARTEHLRAGGLLSDFVQQVGLRLGIGARILPMTDEDVRTIVETDEGSFEFQRYFVEQRCRPRVQSVWFCGASRTQVSAAVGRAIVDADRAIVICPSNPYLSIDPMLAIPGVRAALQQARAPVVAVSPIIGGQAVKGPTAKIMSELGLDVSNASIAAHYHGLIDGLVIDQGDAHEAAGVDVQVHATRTLMHDLADRVRLADEVLSFAAHLAAPAHGRARLRDALDGVEA